MHVRCSRPGAATAFAFAIRSAALSGRAGALRSVTRLTQRGSSAVAVENVGNLASAVDSMAERYEPIASCTKAW